MRLLRLRVQLDGSRTRVHGPAALAKGFRFVGDARPGRRRAPEHPQRGARIWDCTRCYFCNERCPKGVDPRDAIAKLGAESIRLDVDHDMGAKHAKWFVKSAETTGWLRETELVPKTQGVVEAIKQIGFALNLAKHGKAAAAFPPHVAKDARGPQLRELIRTRGARVRWGSSRASMRSARSSSSRSRVRARTRRRSSPGWSPRTRRDEQGRLLHGLPRGALGQGAQHLDEGARAEARDRAR